MTALYYLIDAFLCWQRRALARAAIERKRAADERVMRRWHPVRM